MITAKLTVDAEIKNIQFGRTIIDWNRQQLIFQLSDKNHIHDLTNEQLNYLVNGLKSLMSNIPKISNVVIPEFNPNINDEGVM